ncbi:DUF4920 domain-containing protein [Flavobacterium sp. PLA-1-15]|uniref:DUF4920 domain-containing protein n=1 Tax=Flavobacterium sp. PLA-1-15 TaxID=3380533 RepID=UPI003B7F26D3
MKKIFILICSLSVLISCKNKSEEVEIDEIKTETPADTIASKDTLATIETVVPEVKEEKINEEDIKEVKVETKEAKMEYASFGSKFKENKALTKEEMLKKYKSMKKGDTLAVQFKSKIKDVCKKKGCWMSMDLANEKESFVRFKDYGFFVPLNADNSNAIVTGRAYLDVITVDELKHYAKDGGKSEEEIAKITEPKITYAFQADGVLIEK